MLNASRRSFEVDGLWVHHAPILNSIPLGRQDLGSDNLREVKDRAGMIKRAVRTQLLGAAAGRVRALKVIVKMPGLGSWSQGTSARCPSHATSIRPRALTSIARVCKRPRL